MENTFWIGFFWSLFAAIVTSAGIYYVDLQIGVKIIPHILYVLL